MTDRMDTEALQVLVDQFSEILDYLRVDPSSSAATRMTKKHAFD